MTPEPDKISRLINNSNGGSLRFASDDGEVSPGQVMRIEIIKGRGSRIKTESGKKRITPQARGVLSPETGLQFISGGENGPVDSKDLELLLGSERTIQANKALTKDRRRRTRNLQGK